MTIRGVRTSHAVDVVVKSQHVGFEITWLVECKYWSTPVTKVHVLALREIVSDTGADRGIILSESGFQSGAVEAANLTNVQTSSLAELRVSTKSSVSLMRLRELYDRVKVCERRYWDIPKEERIDHGLRPDISNPGAYSSTGTMNACIELLSQAFRGVYPIDRDDLDVIDVSRYPEQFASPEEILVVAEPMVSDLERRLDEYAASR